LEVELFLRAALNDHAGGLIVDERGPHWKGEVTLRGLSYSNTEGWGVVVFSRSHELGVDLERMDRAMKKNHLAVAKRFFHVSEYELISLASPFDSPLMFLDLWMKKEAASKLMRVGLAKMIGTPLPSNYEYRPLEKVREGYRSIVALL
jgi:phosphopantetheinyl transferase (holo-ACP synthase)